MIIRTMKQGLLAMAAFGFAAPVVAESTLEYQLEAGGAHTNNINRGPTDGADENVGILGGALDWTYDSNRVEGAVDATLEHRIYTEDSNDDETLLSLNGAFEFELIERLLSWQVEDTFGQVLQDVFAPDNPQNREDVNVFTTGPIATMALNSNNQLQFVGTYRDVNYEESPQNNDSLSGTLAYQRLISASRTLALNLSSQAVDYDRAIDPDFDRHAATVSFSSETSRSSLELELGTNRVSFGSNRDEVDGSLFRLAFSRDISARLNLSVSADKELSDSGQLFNQFLNARQSNLFGENTANVEAEADALEQRSGSIRLSADQRAGSLYVSASYLDVDFQSSDDQDRDGMTLSIGGNRQLGSGWDLGLSANLNKTDFVDGREDDNLRVTLTLSKQLTRTLSLNAQIAHTERDSSNAGFSFDEDAGRVTLIWQPTRSRN